MPFTSSKCDSTKLKSNLKLCSNRMGLLQKKKTEIGLKNRREIAELIKTRKFERGRIKTEQIVREDYVAEAMEILQTYCDLIVTRFGIFEAKNQVDPALETAISTIIWSVPRLSAEVGELEVIKKLLTQKYSKAYVESCLENSMHTVNPSVIQKLGIAAPSPQLVEMYMMEIAKTYDVPYEPNLDLLNTCDTYGGPTGGSGSGNGGGGEQADTEHHLINFDPNVSDGLPKLPDGFTPVDQAWGHGENTGDVAPYPEMTPFPTSDLQPPPVPEKGPVPTNPTYNYGFDPSQPPSYDATMFPEKPQMNANADPAAATAAADAQPLPPGFASPNKAADHAETSSSSGPDDEDFDELQRRFNELTKRG